MVAMTIATAPRRHSSGIIGIRRPASIHNAMGVRSSIAGFGLPTRITDGHRSDQPRFRRATVGVVSSFEKLGTNNVRCRPLHRMMGVPRANLRWGSGGVGHRTHTSRAQPW